MQTGCVTYRYDAFGNLILPDGVYLPYYNLNNNNPFRFAGQYWDWELGEYYLRARSYNPRLGRFTQPDPHWGIHNMIFGDVPIFRAGRMMPSRHAILQAGNLYVYAINNPIRYIDPTGLFILPIVLPIIPKVVDAVKITAPKISQEARSIAEQVTRATIDLLIMPLFTNPLQNALQRGTTATPSNVPVAQEPALIATVNTKTPPSSTVTNQGSTGSAPVPGSPAPQDPDWRGDDPDLRNIDPNNLPPGWTSRTDNAGRIHIKDATGRYRMRIDPARGGHPAHKHFYDRSGRPVDIRGNPTIFGEPDAHIPLR